MGDASAERRLFEAVERLFRGEASIAEVEKAAIMLCEGDQGCISSIIALVEAYVLRHSRLSRLDGSSNLEFRLASEVLTCALRIAGEFSERRERLRRRRGGRG